MLRLPLPPPPLGGTVCDGLVDLSIDIGVSCGNLVDV
jgi:hypothetical protein